MGTVRYSFLDYKKKASSFLSRHGLLVKGKPLPINIDVLLDKSGIPCGGVPGMHADFGVKGAALKTDGGFAIAIDEDLWELPQYEFYYRFTLAEEVAHILLHTDIIAQMKTLEDVMAYHISTSEDEYRRIEQQARAMASQLLLPSDLFDAEILGWVKNNLVTIAQNCFYSREDLADFIASAVYKNYKLSVPVIRYTLMRYPDPVIDRIIQIYGQHLIQ